MGDFGFNPIYAGVNVGEPISGPESTSSGALFPGLWARGALWSLWKSNANTQD